jgi:hypothetical protein
MSRFRRQTLEQALAIANPGPPEWPAETVPGILDLLWRAYDRLLSTKLSTVNIHDAELQLERSVTALLSDEMQDILHEDGGYCSYRISHERWEMETLAPTSNRPPQYDIAFVWRDHAYLKWPCEAKILKHEKDVSAYIRDVQNAFVPCIYAPFSGSAAMLGLLITGNPQEALRLIGTGLGLTLIQHPLHSGRPHGQSTHARKVPKGKNYPNPLNLNHLIMELQNQRRNISPLP